MGKSILDEIGCDFRQTFLNGLQKNESRKWPRFWGRLLYLHKDRGQKTDPIFSGCVRFFGPAGHRCVAVVELLARARSSRRKGCAREP